MNKVSRTASRSDTSNTISVLEEKNKRLVEEVSYLRREIKKFEYGRALSIQIKESLLGGDSGGGKEE